MFITRLCLCVFLSVFSSMTLAKTIAITTQPAAYADIEERVETVGQVESLQSPVVAAEINARVVKVMVDIGDKVTPSTLLAKLDARPYALKLEEAKSEVSRLDAMIKLQSTQVERYRELLKKRGIDKATFDKAVAEKDSLIAQREYALAKLGAAKLTLQQADIYSPISGIVDSRLVSIGDYVLPGSPLFKVIGHQQLRVRLPFAENLYSQIHKGQKLYLTSVLRPNHPLTVEIDYLRPQIESTSRAIEVFAIFNNTQHWLPGASVHAQLVLGAQAKALVVPQQAIVERPAGSVVYVVKSVGNKAIVEERVIQVGLLTAKGQQVLAGLKAGERLAVDGAQFLSDAVDVEVLP